MTHPHQTGIYIAMSDPALILSQWFAAGNSDWSPAASGKLAWAIQAGDVKTADDLAFWLDMILSEGCAYHDALYLISAYDAKDDRVLDALNALYLEYGHSAKRRDEIDHHTKKFARRARLLQGMDAGRYAYPIAIGAAAARVGASFDMTIRMYLEAFVTRLVCVAAPSLGLGKPDQRDVIDAVRPQIVTLSKSGQKTPAAKSPSISSVPAWMTAPLAAQPYHADARSV